MINPTSTLILYGLQKWQDKVHPARGCFFALAKPDDLAQETPDSTSPKTSRCQTLLLLDLGIDGPRKTAWCVFSTSWTRLLTCITCARTTRHRRFVTAVGHRTWRARSPRRSSGATSSRRNCQCQSCRSDVETGGEERWRERSGETGDVTFQRRHPHGSGNS